MNRIIIHHRTQGKGVEAVHLQGIAGGMRECGHKTKIVSPPGVGVSTDEGKKGVVRSIAGNAPQFFFECLELAHNPVALMQLMNTNRDFGCDILYERYAFLGTAGACAAFLWKVPFILEVNYTVHNDLGVRSRSKTLLPLTRLLEHMVFKKASLLMPVSSRLAVQLAERGYDERKILVSPNAVDPSGFQVNRGQPEGLTQGLFRKQPDVVIGYVGSFAPWHRVDLLIDSCISAAKSVNMNIGLMLIGDGGNKASHMERASCLPGNLHMVFPGFIPHGSLPGYIAAMDIAVMPHSNDYGSPMKIFEYMALAKPVVAPDFGPLRDAINHGRDGLLFTPEDPGELTRALSSLVRDPEQRQAMGHMARLRVEKDHNWKARCAGIFDRLNKNGLNRI